MEFHGWSAQSPRDRPGQRELCSLKTAPWGAGMNTGWKNSKQAINYRRRESSPAPGSFRNIVHTVSGCWGRRGFLVTHTKKKPSWDFSLGQDPRIVSEMALPACRRSTRCRFSICLMALFPFPPVWSWVMLGFPPSDFLRKLWTQDRLPSCGIPRQLGERRRCLWPPRI